MNLQRKLVSRKKLEIQLQELENFVEPTPGLEQYPITPRGASILLSIISNTYNDIQDKRIGDLGCGTGILAIGAALLGAKEVIGVDIDERQLNIAAKNALKLNINDKIQWLRIDIQDFSKSLDVIIQNPPFGVQMKPSLDTIFLKQAIKNAKIIYSIHKSGDKNRSHLQNFIKNQGANIDAVIPIEISIPHLFEFHRKKQHLIRIDLYRIISSKPNKD